jgi:hypothetical protein
VVGLVHSWIAAAERLAALIPDLAVQVGARSWPLAVAAFVAGAAMAIAGARLGRLVAGAGGALIGWLVGVELSPLAAEWGVPAATIGWSAAAVIGVASALAPTVYPLATGALAGTLLGLQVPVAGRAWLGAGVGALLLAGVAVLLRRVMIAASAAIAGVVVLIGALIALSVRFPVLEIVTQRPVLLVGVGAVLAVAGTAFQLGSQRSGGARGGKVAAPVAARRD